MYFGRNLCSVHHFLTKVTTISFKTFKLIRPFSDQSSRINYYFNQSLSNHEVEACLVDEEPPIKNSFVEAFESLFLIDDRRNLVEVLNPIASVIKYPSNSSQI